MPLAKHKFGGEGVPSKTPEMSKYQSSPPRPLCWTVNLTGTLKAGEKKKMSAACWEKWASVEEKKRGYLIYDICLPD